MKDLVKSNYYWELLQINNANFYQIINSLIKIKFKLLLLLQNKYTNLDWYKKAYSNWMKLFSEYEIIWVRNETMNTKGIYSYFDVVLYDSKKDKYIILTLLMEPELLSYPINTISYHNFEYKFNDLLFLYIGCYVFNEQVIFKIIDKYEFITDNNEEIIKIFDQNWIQLENSFLVKYSNFTLEKIEDNNMPEALLPNPNIDECLRNNQYFLRNFIWKQIENKKYKRYSMQELGQKIWHIFEKNNSYKVRKEEQYFSEFIEICEDYYDVDLYEHFWKYRKNYNQENLFYNESDLDTSIMRLEFLFYKIKELI